MQIEREDKGNIKILKVQGRVAGDASLELRRKVNQSIEELPGGSKIKVVLNLGKVTMVDSSGLLMIVGLYESICKRNGKLFITNLGNGLQNVFAITKLTRVFDIYETEDEAVSVLSDDTEDAISA